MSDKRKKPAPPKESDFSDVDRIAGKIEARLESGVKSTTATYADKVFTSIKNKSFQKPDRISALNKLILEFIEIKKCPPWNDDIRAKLITYLRNQKGHGIIEDVVEEATEDDDEGIYLNGEDVPISLKALRGRFYRMRDKYHKSHLPVRTTSTQ